MPASVQVFAWLATMWRGSVRRQEGVNGPALFMLGFLCIFALGGLTGVMVAVLPFDWQAHDSYFIVAHLHYVLVGGMLFPVFAGICYWLPLLNGHTMSGRWTRWSFWLMFGGFNLGFFTMHITGLQGMPRRVYTYAPDLGWNGLNMVSTVGAFVFAAGVLVFTVEVARTLLRQEKDKGNPWGAATLEWLPDEEYGPRSIPLVTSEEPLWEQEGLAEQVERGAHFLPGTATGRRETIFTSWKDATPRYLLVLASDSWWPLIAAAGTAGYFLLLTVSWTATAWLCGLAAVGAVIAWLWQTDRVPPMAAARVADRLVLPVGERGAMGHSWWACVIMLVVDACIFASFGFAHVHLSMELAVCPPPGSSLPGAAWTWASSALWLAAAGLMAAACRPERLAEGAGQRGLRWLAMGALACALAAMGCDIAGQSLAGLSPKRDAWSASVAVMTAYQGLHVVLLALALPYLCAVSYTHLTLPTILLV